jgi:hypothetical protein
MKTIPAITTRKEAKMNWLETVTLRTSGNARELIGSDVLKILSKIGRTEGLAEMKIYFHAFLRSDFSAFLFWETETSPVESEIGQKINGVLKEFGLTNHTIWKEEQK